MTKKETPATTQAEWNAERWVDPLHFINNGTVYEVLPDGTVREVVNK